MATPCTWIAKRDIDPPFLVHSISPNDSDILAVQIDGNIFDMGIDEMRDLHEAIGAAIDARESTA